MSSGGTVNKFGRAFSMEITTKDRKLSNTAAEFKSLKTISKRKNTDETKGP